MDKKTFNEIIWKTDKVINKLLEHEVKSVCICGSSKYCDLIAVIKWEIEKKGIIATGLHLLPEWYAKNMEWKESHHGAEQENVADILDELHLRKIDMCECVLIVNPNDYIGERTTIEREYAFNNNINYYYWEV